ncbi:MAG TPA: hypothetical protein VIM41_08560, partial [Gammaproteobacteria bacterium]
MQQGFITKVSTLKFRNYSPVGGAGISCRGTPQVRPCRLDCGHPWPQTPPARDTGTALTYAA